MDEGAPDPCRDSEAARGSDWSVRHQLAASIGLAPHRGSGHRVAARGAYGDDPITVDATLSGVRGGEAALLERLLQASPTSRRSATRLP